MPINGRTYVDSDGHVDSIRHLLGSSNITNPQSREHNLLRLLTTHLCIAVYCYMHSDIGVRNICMQLIIV